MVEYQDHPADSKDYLPPPDKQPVIRVTIFEDGTFLVVAHPEHHSEIPGALQIIVNAIKGGADYLVTDM